MLNDVLHYIAVPLFFPPAGNNNTYIQQQQQRESIVVVYNAVNCVSTLRRGFCQPSNDEKPLKNQKRYLEVQSNFLTSTNDWRCFPPLV